MNAATTRASLIKGVDIILSGRNGYQIVLFCLGHSYHFFPINGVEHSHFRVGSSEGKSAIFTFHYTVSTRSYSAEMFLRLFLVVSHNDDAAQARISFRHGSLRL
ncbi:hypothetical protein D3C78_1748850 [compost metagenome]